MRHAIKMLGLVFVLALSACGGEGGDDVGQFVGIWGATSGAVRRVCPGDAPQTDAPGSVVWSAGTSSDLVSKTALTPCRLMADVTGATAFAVPGHSCTQSDGADATVTVTVESYSFAISSDGTATEKSSGRITRVDRGVATTCSFDDLGRYQKIGG